MRALLGFESEYLVVVDKGSGGKPESTLEENVRAPTLFGSTFDITCFEFYKSLCGARTWCSIIQELQEDKRTNITSLIGVG